MWHRIFASVSELAASVLLTCTGQHCNWLLMQVLGGMVAVLPAVSCLARRLAVPEDERFVVSESEGGDHADGV
jgi:hypothetical protein